MRTMYHLCLIFDEQRYMRIMHFMKSGNYKIMMALINKSCVTKMISSDFFAYD